MGGPLPPKNSFGCFLLPFDKQRKRKIVCCISPFLFCFYPFFTPFLFTLWRRRRLGFSVFFFFAFFITFRVVVVTPPRAYLFELLEYGHHGFLVRYYRLVGCFPEFPSQRLQCLPRLFFRIRIGRIEPVHHVPVPIDLQQRRR